MRPAHVKFSQRGGSAFICINTCLSNLKLLEVRRPLSHVWAVTYHSSALAMMRLQYETLTRAVWLLYAA
ncbi:DUF6988 family protein [Pseudomonas viridiflava]|uniref:DUF6988 family protein n=1 Tax=Pseudomonas viridiflava TaxID=33069 RepID=UPI000F029E3F